VGHHGRFATLVSACGCTASCVALGGALHRCSEVSRACGDQIRHLGVPLLHLDDELGRFSSVSAPKVW
jgi:hypothetical protein